MPTNFILGGIARRTDGHLLENGKGNFGTLGFVDWVMGTSLGGNIVEDVGAEAEKRDLPGKAERKGKKGLEGAKRGLEEIKEGRARRGQRGSDD